MNWLIFPYPKLDNKKLEKLQSKIIKIPTQKFVQNLNISKTFQTESFENIHIPCHWNYDYFNQEDQILIYLHGNAEDILGSEDISNSLKEHLKLNVLTVEYPGYSIYKDAKPSQEQIYLDIINVYEYVIDKMNIQKEKIYVFGRSIGTGPATYLARNRQIGKLILMSPFTSMRDLFADYIGNYLKKFFKDRFNNLKEIKEVYCSTLFIHGKIDKLINQKHTQKLYGNYQIKLI